MKIYSSNSLTQVWPGSSSASEINVTDGWLQVLWYCVSGLCSSSSYNMSKAFIGSSYLNEKWHLWHNHCMSGVFALMKHVYLWRNQCIGASRTPHCVLMLRVVHVLGPVYLHRCFQGTTSASGVSWGTALEWWESSSVLFLSATQAVQLYWLQCQRTSKGCTILIDP